MYDANSALQTLTTITATATSTSFDLGTSTPRRGLKARIRATTVSGTSPTMAVKVQHSTDNSTFTDLANMFNVSLTAAGVDYISFETPNRYIRLVATVGGTTPSFVWDAYLGTARPA